MPERRLIVKDLSEIRQDIDRIDHQIVSLYEERMKLTTEVARYKISVGKDVLDQKRELQKLKDLSGLAHSDFTRHGVRELFEHIMSMSRKKQYQLLTEQGVSFDTGFRTVADDFSRDREIAVLKQDFYYFYKFMPEHRNFRVFDSWEDLGGYLRTHDQVLGFVQTGMEKYRGNVIGYYNQFVEDDLYIVREFFDRQDEERRCLLVTPEKIACEGADKVSLCFEAPDDQGTLYHLLSHITYNNLNLNRIGSVVIATEPLDYRFFIDLSGNLSDSSICNAVRGLANEARNFRIIGNYR